MRVRTSACGWSDISTIFYTVTCSGNFAVYPNPADEQLTIEQTADATNAVPSQSPTNPFITPGLNIAPTTAPFSVELYNDQQEVVATGTAAGSRIQLDTGKLPAGTYYLHIHHKEGILRKQIVIE